MKQFCVTAVYKKHNRITHVMMHPVDEDGTVYIGVKRNLPHLISHLKKLDIVRLLKWDYEKGVWYFADHLKIVNTERELVKSHKDHIINDNFDKLVNIESVGF